LTELAPQEDVIFYCSAGPGKELGEKTLDAPVLRGFDDVLLRIPIDVPVARNPFDTTGRDTVLAGIWGRLRPI
jgi:hypothetical protein